MTCQRLIEFLKEQKLEEYQFTSCDRVSLKKGRRTVDIYPDGRYVILEEGPYDPVRDDNDLVFEEHGTLCSE